MTYKIVNHVKTTLSADVAIGATSISVNAAAVPYNTPPDPGGDTVLLVLTDSLSAPTKFEIVSYTGRTGPGPYTLTGVTRGLEGTSDQAWTVGNICFADITAAMLSDLYAGVYKQILTANTTYYVATTGSDTTGDGTAGNPWRTIQHAIDYVVANLDTAGFDVTINVAAGTYAENLTLKSFSGGGDVIIVGDEGVPSNVVLQPASGRAVTSLSFAPYHIQGVKITTTNSDAFYVTLGNRLYFKRVEFGEVGTGRHIRLLGGFVQVTGPYAISGSAGIHIDLGDGAVFVSPYTTVTITNTPSFTYIWADRLSVARLEGVSYIGSSTGQRYYVNANSVCFTGNAGSNYLPGDTSGATYNGGLYL